MTPFLTKNLYFRTKNSFMSHFLGTSYFPAHPITLLLQILEGRMHGPSPTSNFGGTVPPVPPKSPPVGQKPAAHSYTLTQHQRRKSIGIFIAPCQEF